jgi:hypothetical protein
VHRLFLDANVLFTAAQNPLGKAAFLFESAAVESRSPWVLLSSAYAIEEARRNLAAKAASALAAFAAQRERLTLVPQPAAAAVALDLPAKDQPIWSAALAAGATHLLTGDLRDFGRHMNRPETSGGICIQTVGDYLASL